MVIMVIPNVTVAKQKNDENFQLEQDGLMSGDAPVYLGKKKDPKTNEVVEGYAFVHHKKAFANKKSAARTPVCYGYLATGARWKVQEPWVINPANSRGLASDFIFSTISSSIDKWEDAGDGYLNNGVSVQMLGNGNITNSVLTAESASPDGVNEVYFGSVADSGAIAVTTVWGIFSGPTQNRKLVEWDMVFDQVDFDWASNGDVAKMDFENIATHELGHAVGMGDIYNSSCSSVTMYGYATEGETKKRDLAPADIEGVDKLY